MPSYHTSGFEVMKTLSKEKLTSKKLQQKKAVPSELEKCMSDKECQTRYLEAFGDCD
ncbi:MAG: hypothetical protein O3A03_03835 [Proteobacteria bacterium]|nr:hypothetical protein [Pseudomonadota bacterium]